MASEIDICNLALGHLGDEATVSAISPPDGSAQAGHCARFYPMARDALLEMHNWRFATRRVSLALLSTTELPAEWAFAYAYPQCLRVVAVFPPDVTVTSTPQAIYDQSEFLNRPRDYPFVCETLSTGAQVIYTNVEDATVQYIAQVTDTTKFSPLFIVAFARLLSSYLAGPIIKGKAGMEVAKEQLSIFTKLEGMQAKVSDAQAGKNNTYNDFVPASLAARA